MDAPRNLIFLSHASIDEEIAKSLKHHIEASFPSALVFVSSDPEDLAPGDDWTQRVLNALEKANLVLALTTKRGLGRRWVWFESGRAWYAAIKLIPCCIGKVRKSELPPPFCLLQSLNIDEPEGYTSLLKSIEKSLGTAAISANVRPIVDELIRLDVRCEEREQIYEDPDAVELRFEIEKVMKALDPGSREAIRLVLTHGEMSDGGATKKVNESGLRGPNYHCLIALENETNWLSKVRSSPYPNVSREEDCYAVKPKIAPYLREYFAKSN
jgi:hypothetical protein